MIKKIKNSGFTLIELLVVIAIIGVLASIVLVSLGGARAKASASKAKSDLSQVMTAIELFQSDNTNTNQMGVGSGTAAAGADTTNSCGTLAVEFDGSGTAYTTTDTIFNDEAANADLCSGKVFKSDGTNAVVKNTVYMQVLPAPPASYFYELEAAGAAGSYSIRADGFTDDATAKFICTNGSCYCSVSNMCQK